jgi:protein-disulfide isomerase
MNRSKWIVFFLFLLSIASLPLQAAAQASGQILGGSRDAPIRIEVFSDFQCPSCRELYLDVMRRTLVEYSSQNKVCLIYHEFPIKTHQYSREAARYAEAASRLGRDQMLKVYDSLFMEQGKWSENGKVESAVSKALSAADFQKLKKTMQDPAINAAIEREIELGQKKQIISTPTFFVYAGGKEQKVEGRLTYPMLKQFIDMTLK